jgi:electron transfer flavoprotein beta subunit
MRVIVCVKQVMDPEMPVDSFMVDREKKQVIPPPGTPPVVSPFDENAIEAALRLNDKHGAEVFALSIGKKLSKHVVKKSLSAGADELFLVEHDSFEALDSFGAAHVLAKAIRKIGEFDIVLTGRQAADWDNGVTGSVLAELLNIPCITVARKIEVDGDKVRVERVVENGYEVVDTTTPCLVTVSNELGELRQITLPGINKAKKKPVTEWKASDIDMDEPPPLGCDLLDLYIPTRDTVCQMITGETPEETAENLAEIICKDCQF